MEKIKKLSDYLNTVSDLPQDYFYRGESKDFQSTACVATANRDEKSYDKYQKRMDLFDRKIRESNLLNNSQQLIPFAQHSGLSTKLLDVTSNPLVALFFACQRANENSDGIIYIFDDYADATDIFETYPNFDLENELTRHIELLTKQKQDFQITTSDDVLNDTAKAIYGRVEHAELNLLGNCIENYRDKFLIGEHNHKSFVRGVSEMFSPFVEKKKNLFLLLDDIKDFVILFSLKNKGAECLLPNNHKNNPSAIDYIHPYQDKRYNYYNEQYADFDLEVKEYLIALECLIAFINDRSPFSNLAASFKLPISTLSFLPNMIYRPVMTFKRGLSQQSAFFVQTSFDKHEVNLVNPETNEKNELVPRQLLNCQASFKKKLIIDDNSKLTILAELDRIGVNKAAMFGDADNIASYIMNFDS
ncbi:FRG domain-containing protein [Leuconostoc falkenbergense]|uniref:FRG domain-containing protein n=1 Tax=Leuconostoc falkenbergense TaxID=2766470 RepID=UPI0024AD1F2F|nr:FRG domain-containing protein [Leuconostoc falkenbergense]MDI6666658.1 FRG domain-containing protein [Leuconostoc falkenbergense]